MALTTWTKVIVYHIEVMKLSDLRLHLVSPLMQLFSNISLKMLTTLDGYFPGKNNS